jgi:serine/threonine-protein kinase RsbW
MPEQNATEGELEIARLRVLADSDYLGAVIAMVTHLAKAAGLSPESARKLDAVLVCVFQNIIEYGYEGDSSQPVDVTVALRANSLVVRVEDRGKPYDFERLERGENALFTSILAKGYASDVHFSYLGARGNRVELIRQLPSKDIRREREWWRREGERVEEPAGGPLITRELRPEEALSLVRLFYSCYGYTYDRDFMYYPDQVEARLREGLMKSFAVFSGSGEMVAHIALNFEYPGAPVAESGQAVVDPRYRKMGLFTHLLRHIGDWGPKNGVKGIYAAVMTAHPFAQRGALKIGAREAGFLLGYAPAGMSLRRIREEATGRRQTMALMYRELIETPPESVYPPIEYKEMVRRIYENCGIKRVICGEGSPEGSGLPELGQLTLTVRPDHNHAYIIVGRCGQDIPSAARYNLNQARLSHIDCIYADLPLQDRGCPRIASALRKMGFFFGGVIPLLRGGDVLRLQYLNNVRVEPEDIKTASPFGRKLLDWIFEDMAAVGG